MKSIGRLAILGTVLLTAFCGAVLGTPATLGAQSRGVEAAGHSH